MYTTQLNDQQTMAMTLKFFRAGLPSPSLAWVAGRETSGRSDPTPSFETAGKRDTTESPDGATMRRAPPAAEESNGIGKRRSSRGVEGGRPGQRRGGSVGRRRLANRLDSPWAGGMS